MTYTMQFGTHQIETDRMITRDGWLAFVWRKGEIYRVEFGDFEADVYNAARAWADKQATVWGVRGR